MSLKHKMFGEEIPEDKKCDTLLKSARLTWIEAKILEALVQSRVDMAKASDDINNVVKTFKTARVVATDLNSTLWTNCQRVTKSLPVQ